MAMASLVPEYLRTPELVFEVKSRGEEPAENVKNLRVQLRKLMSTEQSWKSTFDCANEFKECVVRVEELSGELSAETIIFSVLFL